MGKSLAYSNIVRLSADELPERPGHTAVTLGVGMVESSLP